MKKIKVAMLSLFMVLTMSGCGMVNKTEKAVDDSAENAKKDVKKAEKDMKNGVDDLMAFFKGEGVEYSNDKKLDQFDWPAQEGRSFMYNNQNVYLYKVDPSDAKIAGLLDKAQTSNRISATQNGEQMEYGASVNGSYLLVYDKDAMMDDLVEIFKKYDMKTNQANQNMNENK